MTEVVGHFVLVPLLTHARIANGAFWKSSGHGHSVTPLFLRLVELFIQTSESSLQRSTIGKMLVVCQRKSTVTAGLFPSVGSLRRAAAPGPCVGFPCRDRRDVATSGGSARRACASAARRGRRRRCSADAVAVDVRRRGLRVPAGGGGDGGGAPCVFFGRGALPRWCLTPLRRRCATSRRASGGTDAGRSPKKNTEGIPLGRAKRGPLCVFFTFIHRVCKTQLTFSSSTVIHVGQRASPLSMSSSEPLRTTPVWTSTPRHLPAAGALPPRRPKPRFGGRPLHWLTFPL